MNKTKVIIPALAMIGLSAVASVTGTVAWFTAQRTGQLTTGNFAVTKTDGDLLLDVDAGIGTVASKADEGDTYETVINAKTSTKTTDASFNLSSRLLYSNVEGSDNSFVALGDADTYKGTTETAYQYSSTIYYAYTWKVNLTLQDPTAYSKMNVFFDYNGSTMTASKQSGSGEVNGTSAGFRIAILNDSTTKGIVFSKLQNAENFACVTGAAASSTYGNAATNTFTNDFVYFGKDKAGFANSASQETVSSGYAHAQDAAAGTDQTTRLDYLGTMQTGSTTMTLTCIAWYEGTDPNVVNGKDLEQVSSLVKFYSTNVAL